MEEEHTMTYQCAYCGEENQTFVDPSGGNRQTYTEDCAICCRPNVLHIVLSPEGDVTITVEFEG
ncbi:MAG: CPXCG motif-containing cysteine-rich protein [Ignavibacteria bacterium]|nr:CPXCG motif-containing cysteine-rich protein [Ignavibacteria bacterium]MBI3766187.1 CPXCG motif-containing cysteine-rich protein [Ignavibacteriales bacterium]